MKYSTVGGLVALAVTLTTAFIPVTRTNAALVFDLGEVITGSTPGSSPPWLRATLTQVDGTSVLIKMDAISLVTSPYVEAVKDWAFNLNPAIATSELSAVEVARSGSFQPNPILAMSGANGYGGFSFDFDFDFATAGGTAITRFTDGDSVTMKLSRAGGLLESDFNYFASHDGRDFYSGAHLISLANGRSAFVGAASGPEEIPAVPESGTILAGVLLLLPFAVSTIRILRKNRAA
jgi:hypothetical protein